MAAQLLRHTAYCSYLWAQRNMPDFRVKFWGVRGSIACPSPTHAEYGGNTSCVELELDGQHLILDAGTGLRRLGRQLLQDGVKSATLLLTHVHWDHTNGFPFFGPLFVPDFELRIIAGSLLPVGGVREALAGQMAAPNFPVPLDALAAKLEFRDVDDEPRFELGHGIVAQRRPLNHPDGATGYRIEFGGKSLCYVTDTEHTPGQLDENIQALIRGADLVIYDCTYTDDELSAHVGWGHSTWQQGVRLCQASDVKRLAIFHHDPDHDDVFMARIEAEAKHMWDGAIVAREGMSLVL